MATSPSDTAVADCSGDTRSALRFGETGRWLSLAATVFRVALLLMVMVVVLLLARAPVARVGRAAAAEPVRAAWLARSLRGLTAAIERGVDALLTWYERTQMRRQLLMLDDRLLKDIGISRLEAMHEAEKPFWRV